MPETAESAESVRRIRAWTTDQALPLWAEAGVDRRQGGFFERLQLNGTADVAAARRTRVQARQIYVYSHAAVLGWHPKALDIALHGLEYLVAKCRSPDRRPGYVHTLTPQGEPENRLRDTYDHAFILLALAWLARASGDAQVDALIDEVLAFFDEHLAAGDGTFFEDDRRSEPRRQNPHMHLFEAMLALHETRGHSQALPRAERLQELLHTHFLEAHYGTVREYFTADWRPWPGQDNVTFEPGHHAEWTWLLRRHERLTGTPVAPLPSRLLDRAVRTADPATGLLMDEADAATGAIAQTRRCWPQTELAKAWIAEAEAGRDGAAEAAGAALDGLHRHYLAGPVAGGWMDCFDRGGQPLADTIPASTLYHVFLAVAEADRVLGPAATRRPAFSPGAWT